MSWARQRECRTIRPQARINAIQCLMNHRWATAFTISIRTTLGLMYLQPRHYPTLRLLRSVTLSAQGWGFLTILGLLLMLWLRQLTPFLPCAPTREGRPLSGEGDCEMARRFSSFSEIAAAMYPSLSPEAKAKEAAEAKAQAEQRDRSKRMAADLRAMRERMREEKRR
jgi:hypothetical protein